MFWIPIIMAATSAISSIAQGHQQSKIAKQNASIAEQNAAMALKAGQAEADKKREQIARFKASQAAQMASNGVDTSTGSGLDVLVDTAVNGEFDAQNIMYNAKVKQNAYLNEASMLRSQAKDAKTGGYIGALASAATAAAFAYGSGMFDGGGASVSLTDSADFASVYDGTGTIDASMQYGNMGTATDIFGEW